MPDALVIVCGADRHAVLATGDAVATRSSTVPEGSVDPNDGRKR
ncbi:hypothetical protein [Actinomycetospora chiangmaiensis]|nr:hypothetical protein [Actinomycetospora chiangmaiensis]